MEAVQCSGCGGDLTVPGAFRSLVPERLGGVASTGMEVARRYSRNMHPRAVLIAYNHPTNNSPLCGTGILFGDSFVITQGTILVPLLHIPSQRRWMKSLLSSLTESMTVCPLISNNVKFRVYEDRKMEGVKSLEGEVIVKGAWKCPLVSKSVKTLFHDWTMGDMNRGQTATPDAEASKDLMSVFVVLGTRKADVGLGSLLGVLGEPLRGQDVLVESTPFGSELFMNSLSRGIISNVLGCERCLLLTDARTVIGCEGGPIFGISSLRLSSAEKGRLLGMVCCSLTWWRGEWVGLTIGISLAPVLRRIGRPQLPSPVAPLLHVENPLSDSAVQSVVDETVVLVRCGCSWGSGVVVDVSRGIVLTCAHVIRNEKSESIFVFYRGSGYPADIIFRSRDNVAFDIAVLCLREPHPFTEQMELDDLYPKKGETVIAAGFPLFSEREEKGLLPTLVKGCVARVCQSMIQTTCCIQSGASGGAILRGQKLLGLVVCNAQDSNTGALFPHVNFAIPVSCFREAILKYVETNDLTHLKTLESNDMTVQNIWRLQSSKL